MFHFFQISCFPTFVFATLENTRKHKKLVLARTKHPNTQNIKILGTPKIFEWRELSEHETANKANLWAHFFLMKNFDPITEKCQKATFQVVFKLSQTQKNCSKMQKLIKHSGKKTKKCIQIGREARPTQNEHLANDHERLNSHKKIGRKC